MRKLHQKMLVHCTYVDLSFWLARNSKNTQHLYINSSYTVFVLTDKCRFKIIKFLQALINHIQEMSEETATLDILYTDSVKDDKKLWKK